MTWEQKFAAMAALCGWPAVSLRMRKPGDWYVEARGREVSTGRGTLSGRYGNGHSPEAAILDDWCQVVEQLGAEECIVINSGLENERRVRWNGYMWESVL